MSPTKSCLISCTLSPDMKHAVCAILLKDGEILLGRRSDQGHSYSGCWDLIGGHVEAGESFEDAFNRELQEELAIVPVVFALLGTIRDPRPDLNDETQYHIIAVTAWDGTPTMLGDEHIEIRWFRIADACSLPDLALLDYVPFFERLTAFTPAT